MSSKQTPYFSVIVPTRNRAHLIERAIDSVLSQTYGDWELIIIDDGSTDTTKSVVSEYNDPRIAYFYQDHSERSTARNLGIEKSSGKYVCFLDDDDEFLSDHLEIFYKSSLEHPKSVLRTGMIIKTGKKENKSKHYNKKVHPVEFFLKNMAGIHTLCFPQEGFLDIRFGEKWKHFQDTHLLIRVLLKFPFVQIPAYTVIYHLNADSGSYQVFKQQNTEERLENNIGAIESLFSEFGEDIVSLCKDKDIERYMVGRKYHDYATAFIRHGRNKEGWNCYKQFVRIFPNRLEKVIYLSKYSYSILRGYLARLKSCSKSFLFKK